MARRLLFATVVIEVGARPGLLREQVTATQAEWAQLLADSARLADGEGFLPAG